MRRLSVFLVVPAVCAGATWYRGNTHTHTLDSDGQQTPAQVIEWYRSNGYNFLALTDHDWFSMAEVSGLAATYNTASFMLMTGEEVTDRSTDRPYVHIVGLGINQRVPAAPSGSLAAVVVSTDVNAVRAAGGVPIYAHPNYSCCPTASDMILNGLRFMEIMNPSVGDSNDALWDSLLSAGALVYGLGVDDEHSLDPNTWAPPGRAWIVVRASSLSIPNLLAAMQNGDFYASTGVQLTDVAVTSNSYSVTVAPVPGHAYRIQFFGHNGQELLSIDATSATYSFRGNEHYVRALVRDVSVNVLAWTQPKFVTPVTVNVSPGNATMNAGATKDFKVKVNGTTNDAVNWILTPNIGTITQTGTYTAPSLSAQQTVTIQAVSVENPTAIGTSIVTVKAAH
jgi:hypothetical protein